MLHDPGGDHIDKKPWYKSHPNFEKLLGNFLN